MKADNYIVEYEFDEQLKRWLCVANTHTPRYRKQTFSLDRAVLLVVDVQDFFTCLNSHAYLPVSDFIVSRIRLLMDYFTINQRPILVTQYGQTPGYTDIMGDFWRHVLQTDEALYKLDDRIQDCIYDVIQKPSYSSFIGTDLLEIIQRQQISQIIITGFMTHLCCDYAAREAFSYGLHPFLVADAMGSMSEELHMNTLLAGGHGYAHVVQCRELGCIL